MQVLGITTRDRLVLEWLRSERWKVGAPIKRQLIDDPNLTDVAENRERSRALFSYRYPIIGQLPDDIEPKWVSIEPGDLPNLYIVPTFDWFLDTGGTFHLTDTAANLKADRGYDCGSGPVPISHHQEVAAKASYLNGYDAATTNEVLILIAPDESGPYTIIDGTHRATALYLSHLQSPNTPWKGMLLADPRIANCVWHVDSPQAQQSMRQLPLAVSQDLLW